MADKWLFLKVIEFLFVLSCLIAKRVTDDEEFRLFLYLQKLSREWSLLNSVTWDRVGSAVADAVYGGYLIITFGMILGRALKELPSKKRAMERFFLGIGAILFVILGSLEFAALDSIPPDLLDNAAVLGTLSILTGVLFLIDMSAPRLKSSTKHSQTSAHLQLRPLDIPPNNGIENLTTNGILVQDPSRNGHPRNGEQSGKVTFNGNGITNGVHVIHKSEVNNKQQQKQKKQKSKKFDIFGHDKDDEIAELAERMERHSPVFGKTHKAQYGQYDNMSPTYLRFQNELDSPDKPPSTPGDPGYVQYTAKRWGQPSQKTPRNSPTDV